MRDDFAQFADLNPAQRRVLDELLAWDEPRPVADPDQGPALRRRLERSLEPTAAALPPRTQLWLGKTALSALDCEGRFLDLDATPFEWSVPTIEGLLAHTAIDLDHAGERAREPRDVVAEAWRQVAQDGRSSGAFVSELGGVEADDLRRRAMQRLLEFRECFPPLPPQVEVRSEPALAVHLHEGRVQFSGRPDLALGRAQVGGQRRLLLLDFKTGARRPLQHRAEMRFYALLATLKYGVAPFRVATYYLDEAGWDVEDVDDGVLEAAVRTVEDKAPRGARLQFDPPPDEQLRLVAGPACRWCGRAPDCPARRAWEAGNAERDF